MGFLNDVFLMNKLQKNVSQIESMFNNLTMYIDNGGNDKQEISDRIKDIRRVLDETNKMTENANNPALLINNCFHAYGRSLSITGFILTAAEILRDLCNEYNINMD